MDREVAQQVAKGFVRAMESNDVSVFTEDVFCDINVPEWRFQIQGRDAVAAWLADEQPKGCEIGPWSSEATEAGVLVELEQRDGEEISRNLHRLTITDGRIAEWTMYCTGVWSKDTQERQRREAPMLRQ